MSAHPRPRVLPGEGDSPHSVGISAGPGDHGPGPKAAAAFAAGSEQEAASAFVCAPTRSHLPLGVDGGFHNLSLFKHAPSLFVCCAIYRAIKIFRNVSAKTLPQSLCCLPKDGRAFRVSPPAPAPSSHPVTPTPGCLLALPTKWGHSDESGSELPSDTPSAGTLTLDFQLPEL